MLRIIIIVIILLFGCNFGEGNCNPIPNPEFASILNITNSINTNTKSVEFNITLSNNEVLKVNLSLEFMRQPSSTPPPPPPTTKIKPSEWVELITESSTPTPPAAPPTSTANDEDNAEDNIKVTVDQVIELFQANLIEKEKNIGGILNATVPFYRHFNLQYKESAISIRCLYKSNYEKRTLNIKCNQYIETIIIERLLANGEVEQTFVEKNPNTLKNIILNEDINN